MPTIQQFQPWLVDMANQLFPRPLTHVTLKDIVNRFETVLAVWPKPPNPLDPQQNLVDDEKKAAFCAQVLGPPGDEETRCQLDDGTFSAILAYLGQWRQHANNPNRSDMEIAELVLLFGVGVERGVDQNNGWRSQWPEAKAMLSLTLYQEAQTAVQDLSNLPGFATTIDVVRKLVRQACDIVAANLTREATTNCICTLRLGHRCNDEYHRLYNYYNYLENHSERTLRDFLRMSLTRNVRLRERPKTWYRGLLFHCVTSEDHRNLNFGPFLRDTSCTQYLCSFDPENELLCPNCGKNRPKYLPIKLIFVEGTTDHSKGFRKCKRCGSYFWHGSAINNYRFVPTQVAYNQGAFLFASETGLRRWIIRTEEDLDLSYLLGRGERALAITGDGKWLLKKDQRGSLILSRITRGGNAIQLENPRLRAGAEISCMAVSWRTAAFAYRSGLHTGIFLPAPNRPFHTKTEEPITSIAITNSGDKVLFVSDQRLWVCDRNGHVGTVPQFQDYNSVQISAKGSNLVALGRTKLELRKIENNGTFPVLHSRQIRGTSLLSPEDQITHVTTDRNRETLLIACRNRLLLWKPKKGNKIQLVEQFTCPIISLALSEDSSYGAVVTKECFKIFKLEGPTGPQQILRCPHCRKIQGVTGEGQLIHWFRGESLSSFEEGLVPGRRTV